MLHDINLTGTENNLVLKYISVLAPMVALSFLNLCRVGRGKVKATAKIPVGF